MQLDAAHLQDGRVRQVLCQHLSDSCSRRCIQGSVTLIQEHKVRLLQEHPGQGQQLLLPCKPGCQ